MEDLSGFGGVTRNLKKMLPELSRLGRILGKELYGKEKWSLWLNLQEHLNGRPREASGIEEV